MLLRHSRRKCFLTFWVFFKRSFKQIFNIFYKPLEKEVPLHFFTVDKNYFWFRFENHAKFFSKHQFVGFQFGRELRNLETQGDIFLFVLNTRYRTFFEKNIIFHTYSIFSFLWRLWATTRRIKIVSKLLTVRHIPPQIFNFLHNLSGCHPRIFRDNSITML